MRLNIASGFLSVNALACVSGFAFSPSYNAKSTGFVSLLERRSRSYASTTTTTDEASSSSSSSASSEALVGTPPTPFDDGTSPFEITTPIYYVNDKPHIGHAYTSTACDVIARFMRLSGREVFFLSGTDEHGQKVEQSAEKQGMDPQAFVDNVSQSFRDLLELMNISNDKFIRTTSEEHKQSVQVRQQQKQKVVMLCHQCPIVFRGEHYLVVSRFLKFFFIAALLERVG
jgi:hypothetical protein